MYALEEKLERRRRSKQIFRSRVSKMPFPALSGSAGHFQEKYEGKCSEGAGKSTFLVFHPTIMVSWRLFME